MTTDTVSKQVVVEGSGWSIGGMAKGAGMLAPAAGHDAGRAHHRRRGRRRRPPTGRCAPRPGSASTGSTPTAACPPTTPSRCWPAAPPAITPTEEDFTEALGRACTDLAMQLLADAEGADHDIAITVLHAATEDEAVEVGRSVARSDLFKTAVFGKDPNWGRVLASIGTTDAAFDPADLDVAMNGVWVCRSVDARRGPGRRRPGAARGQRDHRPQGRRRPRHRLDQRPHARLRARELRLLAADETTDDDPRRRARSTRAWKQAPPPRPPTLAEALPWLKQFHGKTIVVKYGGNAMTDDTLKRAFAEDIVFLRYAGFRPVVVHGGGPQISAMLDRLGIESEFQGGLRVTTPEAMDVVRMVLVGQVGRELVGLLNEHGPLAVGLSGEDAGLFTAERTNTVVDGEEVDLGLVGEVAEVRPEAVLDLVDAGRIPVVSLGRARRRRHGAQRQRRHRGRRARGRARRREAARAHRRRGPLPRLAGQRRRDRRDQPRGARRAAAVAGQRHGPQDGGLPARRHAAASRGPPSSTAGSRTPCCWRSSPTRASAPRCCPACPTKIRTAHYTTLCGEAMTSQRASLQQRYAASLMNTFGPPQAGARHAARAPYVWDAEGTRYLDLLGGIAVNALGHAHPALVGAVTASSARSATSRTSSPPSRRSRSPSGCSRCSALPDGGGKVFFTNSGAEANEAAFKLTRRTGRTHLVAMEGSFHGRTMGALALTPRRPTASRSSRCPGDVTFVPYGDADALAAAVTDETAAVVVEPIQGEAGVVVPPDGFLARAREITTRARRAAVARRGADRHGPHRRVVRARRRRGHRPTSSRWPRASAAASRSARWSRWGTRGTLLGPGNHGTTFGGNPVAAAAALAVIDTHREGRPARQRHQGRRAAAATALADPRVTEVRGRGLLHRPRPGRRGRRRGRRRPRWRHGVILNACTPDRIRLAPPLVLTAEQADEFLRRSGRGSSTTAYATAARGRAS